MSLAIKENDFTVSELKLPSPSDLCLGQISLKNCKDATIGTKIDGNVIVNQYFNDTPADKALSNGLTFTDSVVLEDWTQKLIKYKYAWLSLILAVVLTTVLCILYIPHSQPQDNNEDTPMVLNFTEALQTRQQWSKSNLETLCQFPINRPAKYIVIGHTVSLPCHTPLACETTILQINKDHRELGCCDIPYNFVIGDDGYIYEGRGWTKLGLKSLSFSCSSLGIGLIGNFNLNEPSDIMIKLLNLLLKEGIKLGHVSMTYKLIAQSQVKNTASPGIHVEELMKKWDHWSVLTTKDFQCPNTVNV